MIIHAFDSRPFVKDPKWPCNDLLICLAIWWNSASSVTKPPCQCQNPHEETSTRGFRKVLSREWALTKTFWRFVKRVSKEFLSVLISEMHVRRHVSRRWALTKSEARLPGASKTRAKCRSYQRQISTRTVTFWPMECLLLTERVVPDELHSYMPFYGHSVSWKGCGRKTACEHGCILYHMPPCSHHSLGKHDERMNCREKDVLVL